MNTYNIDFHVGTPKESEVVLRLTVKSKADMQACLYRNAVEESVKNHIPFDFTTCTRVKE
jgi:hypothetical protein